MDMKHRSGFRTDQPGVVPTDILNDASLKRIQAKMAYRQPLPIEEIQKTAEMEESQQPKMLRFSSLSLIPKDFEYVGTGLYKKGHHLWSLSKEGDSFVLLRAQEERFDEEEEIEEENGNGEEEVGDEEDEKESQLTTTRTPFSVPVEPSSGYPLEGPVRFKQQVGRTEAQARPGGNIQQQKQLEALEPPATPPSPPTGTPLPPPGSMPGAPPEYYQQGQKEDEENNDKEKDDNEKEAQPKPYPTPDPGGGDLPIVRRPAIPMTADRKRAMQATGADGVVYRDNDLVELLSDGKVYRAEIDEFEQILFLMDVDTGEGVGTCNTDEVVLVESREYGRDANRKQAVDSTAKDYYKKYFGDYGKALTENKLELIAPIVARAYFKMMGRTMPQVLWGNRPKWAMLEKKYGKSLVKDVRTWLGEGITQIRIATVMNVRPEVALLWKPVIDKLGTKTARELRKRIIAGRRFAHSYPAEIMKSAAKAVHGERKLAHRKVAVDEATKEYYRQYFGLYGNELTKNVRDVIMGAPKA